MDKFIGQVYNYEDLYHKSSKREYFPLKEGIFPHRSIFVDPELKEAEIKSIKKCEPIHFLPHYVYPFTLKNKQYIQLYGITPSGSTASVTLEKFDIYFDVFCNKDVMNCSDSVIQNNDGPITVEIINKLKEQSPIIKKFIDHVNSVVQCSRKKIIVRKIMNAGYQKYPNHLGYRLYFETINKRKESYDKLINDTQLYVTGYGNDFISSMFAKSNKQCGSWMVIKNYKYFIHKPNNDQYKYMNSQLKWDTYLTKSDVCFKIDIQDLHNVHETNQKGKVISTDSLEYIDSSNVIKMPRNNIMCSYDIETCKVETDEEYPVDPDLEIVTYDNMIFNITMVMMTESKEKEFTFNIYYTIDGQYHPELAIPNAYNICCNSERQVLLAYTLVMERVQPDFMFHYNGGNFDVPIMMLHARINNVFDEMHCRMSMSYSKYFDVDQLIDYNGYQYQKLYEFRNKYYTNWSDVNASPYISGIQSSSKIRSANSLKRFKINSEAQPEYHYWDVIGSITVDMYFVCYCKYPKERESKKMNTFLEKMNLEPKHDVEYHELMKYWRENNKEGLKKVFEYCAYDSKACYLLAHGYGYVAEQREFSKLVNMPVKDIIYRAGGSKMVNITIKYAEPRGYNLIEAQVRPTGTNKTIKPHLVHHTTKPRLSNRGANVYIHECGKIYYPYVVPQHIVDKFTIDGMTDFALFRRMEEHYDIEFTRNEDGDVVANIIMPVEADDFASLYPSIMMTNNESLETITQDESQLDSKNKFREFEIDSLPATYKKINTKFYTLDHEGDKSKMGILPTILFDMFGFRKSIKKSMREYEEISSDIYDHEFDIQYSKYKDTHTKDEINDITRKICEQNQEYVDAKNGYVNKDIHQRVVKILMNTIYGATSDIYNVLYTYLCAFLTTYTGRKFIDMANDYIRESGLRLCYNDTDSAYFHHNIKDFKDIIDRYLNDEFVNIDFKRKMVTRSIKLTLKKDELLYWYEQKLKKCKTPDLINKYNEKIKMVQSDDFQPFNNRLNDLFKRESGYGYLVMVREETLYPVIFCIKKHYIGIQHGSKFNTNDSIKNFLIRGIALRKGNTTPFLKDMIISVATTIMRSCKTDMKMLILNIVDQYYIKLVINEDIDGHHYDYFAKGQKYKPEMENDSTAAIRNILEIKQMELIKDNPDQTLIELCRTPDHIEVVKHVVTENRATFDMRFRKVDMNKKQRRYTSEVAEYLKLKLDFLCYINSFMSTAAQFLSYEVNWKDASKTEYITLHTSDDPKKRKSVVATILKKMYQTRYYELGYHDISKSRYKSITKRVGQSKLKALFLYWVDSNYTGWPNKMLRILSGNNEFKSVFKYLSSRMVSVTNSIIKKDESIENDIIEYEPEVFVSLEEYLKGNDEKITSIFMTLLYKFNICIKEYFDRMGPFDIKYIDHKLSDNDLLFLRSYYQRLILYPVYHLHRKKSIKIECKVEEL